ncbi:putative regultory protein [Mycobacterium tuberculosis]|nr:putative regultory protein [Mycobacterium tuberculosis]
MISAAVSEVEDYRRVDIARVPDCAVVGAAAGGVIHLLAELIDNALRYSSPTTPVRVAAAIGSEGSVLLRISDSGLGMTDADRRMANMRLRAGGEVTPDSARHMGLFVVGRLAGRHGIRVGLRGPVTGEQGTGTTAEVYLPLAVLEGTAPAQPPKPRVFAIKPPCPEPAAADPTDVPAAIGPLPPVTLLPRRTPGSRGIADVPAQPMRQRRRELKTPWWEDRFQQEPKQPPAPEPRPAPPPAKPAPPAGPVDDDVIYRRMLSEMVGDPHELAHSPDLDWKSVWDHGWSAAAEAADKPVQSRTDYGLPVREPGARLVPGAAVPEGPDREHPGAALASNGGLHPGRAPRHAAAVRDPDAVRASISSHFGGVRTGRSHARESSQGPNQQ